MSDSSLSGVGFWDVVLGVFIPITSAALGIVWKRQDRHEDKDDKNHNELWGAVNEHREKLSKLDVTVAKDYMTRGDFTSFRAEMKKDFDSLGEKLDRLLSEKTTRSARP